MDDIDVDDFENRSEENVSPEINDTTVNGESGCTSPAKKTISTKTSKKRTRQPLTWIKYKNKIIKKFWTAISNEGYTW